MNKILPPNKINIELGLAGVFGKSEIEEAALRLVHFLQYFSPDRWREFPLLGLIRFYEGQRWNPNEVLFGLLGDWLDENTGIMHSSFVVHCGEFMITTKEFQERVSAPSLAAQKKEHCFCGVRPLSNGLCKLHFQCTPEIVTRIVEMQQTGERMNAAEYNTWHMNSYDQDALVPYLSLELLFDRLTYSFNNCSRRNVPATTYEDAVKMYAERIIEIREEARIDPE